MDERKIINVLDHGFVELVGVLGNDLTVVNSARVSFGKRKTQIAEGDIKLMDYLAEHKHWSPFRHMVFQFHVKAPEIVLRQHYKHVVGCSYTSTEVATVDHAWNELSLRYVRADELDFYIPEFFRRQSDDNKQGSSDEILTGEEHEKALRSYLDSLEQAKKTYNELFDMGVAKELARSVIPLSVYTECYWTASLQAVFNYLVLRKDGHAQYEIRQYAAAIETFVQEYAPNAYKALTKAGG